MSTPDQLAARDLERGPSEAVGVSRTRRPISSVCGERCLQGWRRRSGASTPRHASSEVHSGDNDSLGWLFAGDESHPSAAAFVFEGPSDALSAHM
jgi:hypothetical protein